MYNIHCIYLIDRERTDYLIYLLLKYILLFFFNLYFHYIHTQANITTSERTKSKSKKVAV